MNIEKGPQCSFEKPKALCRISQFGTTCTVTLECANASMSTKDLSPAEFCLINSGWTIDAALALRRRQSKSNPEAPFKSAVSWLQTLDEKGREALQSQCAEENDKLNSEHQLSPIKTDIYTKLRPKK